MDARRRSMLSRSASILSAFDSAQPRLTLSDISRRAGLPMPTAHRICTELVALGALERGSDGRYQVGVRLWEVGSLAPRSYGLRELALPIMADLYESTRENVQLVVREGIEALHVERIYGPSAVQLKGGAGSRWPLHASSGGLVLLAHGGAPLLDAVLAAGPRRLAENTVVSERGLRTLLNEVRQQGFVVCDRFVDDVTVAIAAPLTTADGSVVAAMSVAASVETDVRPLVPALRTAARAVSRLLGSR